MENTRRTKQIRPFPASAFSRTGRYGCPKRHRPHATGPPFRPAHYNMRKNCGTNLIFLRGNFSFRRNSFSARPSISSPVAAPAAASGRTTSAEAAEKRNTHPTHLNIPKRQKYACKFLQKFVSLPNKTARSPRFAKGGEYPGASGHARAASENK